MVSTVAPFRRLSGPWPALCAVLFLALGSGACAYLREAIGVGPVRPKVTLTALEVTKISLAALELKAALQVDNPNDFDLTFANLDYRLDAGGLELAQGRYDPQVTIPAEGRTTVRLPVSVNAANAVRLARQLVETQGAQIAVMKARADFITSFGAMEVSFEDKKEIAKLAGF